jgi:alpha-tubulin suppressor-like RCC1 family protein
VAAGRFHNLALKDDGTVWAWGVDQFGQLGDGGEVQPDPYSAHLGPLLAGGLTGVTKIAAGLTHSLALKSDGTLWAWGDNSVGELGDGTRRALDWPDRSTPVRVSGLSGVAAIAGGDGQSLAVTGDGAVWAWGSSTGIWGEEPAHTSTPVPVSGLTGVVAIAASGSHSLALTGEGAVWERGPRQWAYWSTPVQVRGLTGVVAIAAGDAHSVAVKGDGTVWAWGSNWGGQLGDGTTTDRLEPVQVSGLTDVVAVAADYHSLALKSDGTVWAWGDNSWGQLGDGTRTARATPVQVSALNDVAAIATRTEEMFIGIAHSVALKHDGTVWEWPIYESFVPKSLTPVQVAGLTNIVAVAEGGGHSLTLKGDGTVWAWGQNISGQLGVQTFAIRTTPVQVVGPAAP